LKICIPFFQVEKVIEKGKPISVFRKIFYRNLKEFNVKEGKMNVYDEKIYVMTWY
jgi:hypothetical protein